MEEELEKAERNRLAALERKAVTSVANPNLQPFANKGNQVKIEIDYINNMEEFKAVHEKAGADAVVVIDYTASWCPPCKHIGPIFAGMSTEFKNVIFKKVDVDEAKDVAENAGITAMPTFKFYKGGEEIE